MQVCYCRTKPHCKQHACMQGTNPTDGACTRVTTYHCTQKNNQPSLPLYDANCMQETPRPLQNLGHKHQPVHQQMYSLSGTPSAITTSATHDGTACTACYRWTVPYTFPPQTQDPLPARVTPTAVSSQVTQAHGVQRAPPRETLPVLTNHQMSHHCDLDIEKVAGRQPLARPSHLIPTPCHGPQPEDVTPAKRFMPLVWPGRETTPHANVFYIQPGRAPEMHAIVKVANPTKQTNAHTALLAITTQNETKRCAAQWRGRCRGAQLTLRLIRSAAACCVTQLADVQLPDQLHFLHLFVNPVAQRQTKGGTGQQLTLPQVFILHHIFLLRIAQQEQLPHLRSQLSQQRLVAR